MVCKLRSLFLHLGKVMTDKIVLAYSGGLDTSVSCRWLQSTYSAEVVTFTADIGRAKEAEPDGKKAEASGGKEP